MHQSSHLHHQGLLSVVLKHLQTLSLPVLAASRFETAQLPFELRVLETSLRDVTRLCTGLSKEIEADAFPALEALTKKVQLWGLQAA